MQLIKISKKEALEIINEGADVYLVVSHDLEKKINIGKRHMNIENSTEIINKSKTIVLNQDLDDEDSFSMMSLYSIKQKDIFNIIPKGIKHDILLLSLK